MLLPFNRKCKNISERSHLNTKCILFASRLLILMSFRNFCKQWFLYYIKLRYKNETLLEVLKMKAIGAKNFLKMY